MANVCTVRTVGYICIHQLFFLLQLCECINTWSFTDSKIRSCRHFVFLHVVIQLHFSSPSCAITSQDSFCVPSHVLHPIIESALYFHQPPHYIQLIKQEACRPRQLRCIVITFNELVISNFNQLCQTISSSDCQHQNCQQKKA